MATSAFSFSYKLLIVLCMISLLIAAPNHHLAEAAVTCNEVCLHIYPCISYVISGRNNIGVPTTCCNVLKSLNASATTTADRQLVCKCIQSATSHVSFTSYNLRLADSLPAKCGLRVHYKITPTTNCSRYMQKSQSCLDTFAM
ncbi:unnamed protein product [Rhodiola kirilowii]